MKRTFHEFITDVIYNIDWIEREEGEEVCTRSELEDVLWHEYQEINHE